MNCNTTHYRANWARRRELIPSRPPWPRDYGSRGKYLADIYALARTRLARAGCTEVYGGNACTVADAGRFYSYRRDGVTGRMASLVWLAD